MTATQTAHFQFPHAVLVFLRRVGGWLKNGVLAVLIMVMAGVIAVATAAAGLAIAAAAIMISLFGRKSGKASDGDISVLKNDRMTLEARKTPRGWTVE